MSDNPVTDDRNVVLYDDLGNKIGVIFDGDIYRLAVNTFDITDPKKGNFTNIAFENGGSDDMTVDGSTTPVSFTSVPPTSKNFIVYRLILTMEDSSMSWVKFAGRSALANGVLFKVTEDGVERSIITDPIKTNRDYVWNSYDVEIDNATTAVLRMRWTFQKAGTVLTLKDSFSDNLKIIIQDNLTGISYFKATAQGYQVDP